MIGVLVKYKGNSLFTELPKDESELYDELESIGINKTLSEIRLADNSDYEIKLYGDDDISSDAISKISPGDSLDELNDLASELFQCGDRNKKADLITESGFDKLVINTTLLRKEPEFRPATCIVEKAAAVSHAEFETLKRHPLYDNDLIADNVDLMYCDKNNIYHCLLIYDEEQGDGIIAEAEGANYLRYSQYIPNAKLLYENHVNSYLQSQSMQTEEMEEDQSEDMTEEPDMGMTM